MVIRSRKEILQVSQSFDLVLILSASSLNVSLVRPFMVLKGSHLVIFTHSGI